MVRVQSLLYVTFSLVATVSPAPSHSLVRLQAIYERLSCACKNCSMRLTASWSRSMLVV
jgi:hypothetical protein